MPVEFRPTGEPILIDDTYHEVECSKRVGRRLYSNGRHAVEVVVGKKRERWLSQYEFEHRKKPPIVLDAPLRITEEIVIPPVAPTPPAATIPQIIDEQVEAEEFVDAISAYEEPLTVDPLDWFDCTLRSVLPGGRDVVGELENGALVIANERDFSLKDTGHSLCLTGRQAWVRLELNAEAHRHRYAYRAIEAQVVDGDERKRSPGAGTIISWNASMGAAKMDCGCSIGVGTRGADETVDLKVGDKVEFEIYYNARLKRHLGNITVIETEEKNYE